MPIHNNIFTDATIENLCKNWNIKSKSINAIEKKLSDKYAVIARFLRFDDKLKNMIYHLLFSFGENYGASTRAIAQKCDMKSGVYSASPHIRYMEASHLHFRWL